MTGENGAFDELLKSFSSRCATLPDKPEETHRAALRALWFAAAGQSQSVQKSSEGKLPELTVEAEDRLRDLVERRVSGVPLAHLLGWQNFMGVELKAGPQALIPRRETELVGNAALKQLQKIVAARGRALVIDLCTGSGNLAIALALREPACKVVAADLCEDAVSLAWENAALHNLQDRVEFRCGDLFAPFQDGSFDAAVDLIVCNPPYLSVSKVRELAPEIGQFEPRAAFDAGSFGLTIITRLTTEAPRYLKPESWLCFEIGLGQGAFIAARLERSGAYRTVETVLDEAGQVRALVAGT
jgi:release factor glutamine methyltransferase